MRAEEFIPFGDPVADLNPDSLAQDVAKRTLSVCLAGKDFEVVELRRLNLNDGSIAEIIVVDCINDQVPTRNQLGIKVRERLALVFFADQAKMPEVRALRKDFPTPPHLNDAIVGQPASLCLYSETWNAIERTWTPQKHLQRILWWLSETARNGTAHQINQPLERVYFNSPFEIVLPPNFDEKINNKNLALVLQLINPSIGDPKVIRGIFLPKDQMKKQGVMHYIPLVLILPSVVHGRIERLPDSLGALHGQLESRGAPFIERLSECIRSKVDENGITHNKDGRSLLIFYLPVKRSIEAEPERYEIWAFLILKDLTVLGEATGALTKYEDKFYAIQTIGGNDRTQRDEWNDFQIGPVDVKTAITKEFARNSSFVKSDSADFKGILAGVGALGSALAELWAKEAWGQWTLIDPDYIKPHNIVRHVAKDFQIGHFKVDAVKEFMEANYHNDAYSVVAIPDSVTNDNNHLVKEAINAADFLVDATTTLEVPRDLSRKDDVSRLCSIFLTPSGSDSVLLLEDADRNVRLESLEAQYYRAIINTEWGNTHLEGHQGTLSVGAGCRDVSVVLSNEAVLLHAATLARQVRLLRNQAGSCMRVWSSNPGTGAVVVQEIPVYETVRMPSAAWQVICDTGIQEQLRAIRRAHLPNETGGVILGYIDQKLKAIYVVDVLPAPPDSEADPTGFTRCVDGLEASLQEVARRTANIVGYIGEWHSHPPSVSARPSQTDRCLIKKLSEILAQDGLPALMLIVGEEEFSLSVREI